MFVRLRLPVFLVLTAGIFAGGWWLGKNSAVGPAQGAAHPAPAQLPPPSAHPPGYLTTKATPAPPAAGAEALAKLLEQRAKPEDLATAIAAWAEQDPDAAFRALLADPRLQLPATARALFEVLGKNDPAQAFARIAQLPALPWARDANQGLATGWTQRDAQAATTAGLALPPGTRRVDFLQAAFAQWTQQDVIAARDWIMALPPEEPRTRIHTAKSITGAQIHSTQEMAALLELVPIGISRFGDGSRIPFRTWVAKSPDAALQWALLTIPREGDYVSDFLNYALRSFAADPARVLSLLPELNDPKARECLVTSSTEAWMQRNPAAAWAWSPQLTDPSLREAFESSLANRWANQDPDTAIPWLLKNRANQLGNIHSSVLGEWAAATPDEALSMIGHLPVEKSPEELISTLLKGIAQAKPAIALSQLDLLQENKHRRSLIYDAMSVWSGQDITAASAYTDTLPPGEDRQTSIEGILGAAFNSALVNLYQFACWLPKPCHG